MPPLLRRGHKNYNNSYCKFLYNNIQPFWLKIQVNQFYLTNEFQSIVSPILCLYHKCFKQARRYFSLLIITHSKPQNQCLNCVCLNLKYQNTFKKKGNRFKAIILGMQVKQRRQQRFIFKIIIQESTSDHYIAAIKLVHVIKMSEQCPAVHPTCIWLIVVFSPLNLLLIISV